MGMDLYWKITPKPLEEEFFSFEDNFFCNLWGVDWGDREELNGKELTRGDLPELRLAISVLKALRMPTNKDIIDNIQKMIWAIEKHDSITIVARC